MSSSIEGTKIDLMDDEETVRKRINNADCVSGDTNNGILTLVKYLFLELNGEIVIERPEKFGGNLVYKKYLDLEKDFINKILHPLDLKNSVSKEVNKLLRKFRESEKIKKLYGDAYPGFKKK